MLRLRLASVVFAALAVALLYRYYRSPAPVAPPTRQRVAASTHVSVAMDLRIEQDGSTALHAFSLGDPYIIDPHALSFSGRPYANPFSALQKINVAIGDPKYVPPAGSTTGQGLLEFAMPLSFGAAPRDGGLYDVELLAAPGFARTQDGADIAFGDWSRTPERWHLPMWWPSSDDANAGIARLRERFVGRSVYAYGGASLRCGSSVASYEVSAPLPVRAVEREADAVAMIWPGGNAGGLDDTPHFLAVAPLRFVFALPEASPKSYGGSIEGDGCPAITLADWQVDTVLSLVPPPPGLRPARTWYPPIRNGMSRIDVAWLIGYPTEFATRSTLDKEETWTYEGGPKSSISVTFSGDRVAWFTSAGE